MNKGIIGGAIAGAVTLVVSAVGAVSYHKKHTYGEDGFNGYGYDKDGYDREGYNKNGYNRNGYNRDGYNVDGYNAKGFDKEGYDKDGYDSKGYNRDGRDKDGYDRDGKDSSGYYRSGFNSEGYDRGGKSFDYYSEKCEEIKQLLEKAYNRIKESEFKYALSDIREGLEKGVKCIILHLKGVYYLTQISTLDENITVCKRNGLLDSEFVEKLYDAKNHCNDLQHDNGVKKDIGQVWFSYKVLEELYGEIEKFNKRP